ncbi:MAG TPA: aldo/keto reductase [Bacteroidota bacterium]|nr:aldo/keto reductase [Bacteroidota bacterium]
MQYRKLGRTGLTVSEIGFGAWGIGGDMWRGSDDAESFRALHAAVDMGMTLIDTALDYGKGHSEHIVGRFLKERSEHVLVATKVPPKNRLWPARAGTSISDVFPTDYVVACAETSLRNLERETIDLLQLHVWLDDWTERDEWKSALQHLKEEGKIRFAGISINDHQPSNALRVAETGLIDVFQVIYNIFDQTPEKELFPCCTKHGIGVIARVPFDEGSLTGLVTSKTKFPEEDWRNDYFKGDRKAEVERRVAKLGKLLGSEAASLPELALRFCLHADAVSSVIPGMRSASRVRANARISDGRALSRELLEELKEHAWSKNFYD